MSSNYSCVVCGNTRTNWKCTHCDQTDSLRKIAASSDSAAPAASPVEGTEWWLATTFGQILSGLVATVGTLYFIWDWATIHGSLIFLLFETLSIFCIWIMIFVFWPIALGFFVFLWLAWNILVFLFTTTV